MFASKIKKVVSFDDDQVTIRKLSFSALDRARDARQLRSAETIRAHGGEVFKVLRSESTADLAEQLKARRENPEVARRARYQEYDRASVLHNGIVAWSFDEPVDQGHIDDLDEDIAQRLHEEIIDLSAPPPEEAKEEQAKD